MARRQKKLIAFPVYAGFTPLDLVGPLTALRNLAPRSPYRTIVVGERVEPTGTDTPLWIVPVKPFTEVSTPFAVIVPGGGSAVLDAMNNQPVIDYLRRTAATAELVGATGNGALLLAAAGLLNGRSAAVHWAYAEALERLGATYVDQPRVEDGKFLTAAGGAAGIDLALAVLARLTSRSNARLAQLFMEYDPQPPFGPLDRTNTDPALGRTLRTPVGVSET